MRDVKKVCQENNTLLYLSEKIPISHNLNKIIIIDNNQNTQLLSSMGNLMNQKDRNGKSQIKNKFGNLILGSVQPTTTYYRIVSEQNDN